MRTSKYRATVQRGSSLCVLRHDDGVRADLADMVDGGRRASSALTQPSSSSPGATAPRMPLPAADVARIDRENLDARGAALAALDRRNERRRGLVAPRRRLVRRERMGGSASESRPWGAGARPPAHPRRLRLLDLPAQRHRDVLGVLRRLRCPLEETAGGPSGKDLFHLDVVAIETACLLISTVACGFASIGAGIRNNRLFFSCMALTGLLAPLSFF